jgi:hypothetical protein
VSDADERNPGREAILETLERHGVEYVVIGGAAAQARGWPRLTNDIDVTPERSKENLSRLAGALEELSGTRRATGRPEALTGARSAARSRLRSPPLTAMWTWYCAPTGPTATRTSSAPPHRSA